MPRSTTWLKRPCEQDGADAARPGTHPRDGRRPNEADILQSGVYNLGFVAAGPGAVRSGFIDFWRTRLRRDAIVDPERMLFTDQRWVDFATSSRTGSAVTRAAMSPTGTCGDGG